MTLKIVTYLSISPDVSIDLDEETHVYTLNIAGNVHRSDTSVTSVINPNGNNVSFNDAKMKSAAEIGKEKHLLLENTLNRFSDLQHNSEMSYKDFCSLYKEEDGSDPVVLSFLEQLLNLFKNRHCDNLVKHMRIFTEVKIFSIISDENGRAINIGGSIDVLIIMPNKEFWILDLKTAVSQSTKQANKTKYTNQISMYSHLVASRGTFNIINAAYIYSDENKSRFDCAFVASELEKTKPFDYLNDLYLLALNKKFNIEQISRTSEDQDLITKIKTLFNEKATLKEKLKEIDSELDALLEEDAKDIKLGTVYYGDIKYIKYVMRRTTYDINLIKDKCPEAIVNKYISCNKISMSNNNEDENDK
jgi:vacuolar-type H+-ATPase subunit I/STV1